MGHAHGHVPHLDPGDGRLLQSLKNTPGFLEVGPRILGIALVRAHGHESEDAEAGEGAQGPDQGFRVVGHDAGLLGLAAAVDLDEDVHGPAGRGGALVDLPAECERIHGLDEVEDLDRPLDLVRLEVADEMPADAAADRGEDLRRLLDVIFADGPDARVDRFEDLAGGLCFGRGDELHSGRQRG